MPTDIPARYLIAQFLQDPFRREGRNIGVIVIKGDETASKFFAETPEGNVDGKYVQGLANISNYKHWVRSWKEQVAEANGQQLIDGLMEQNGGNYNVIIGGDITGTNGDTAEKICQFLFSNLVSIKPKATVAPDKPVVTRDAMKDELKRSFRDMGILFTQSKGQIPHPVKVDAWVGGQKTQHQASFSQLNGELCVVEPLSFSVNDKKGARDHASWVTLMFEDIKNAKPAAEVIAMVDASKSDIRNDQVKSVLPILEGIATAILFWNDLKARKQFLEKREAIARSIRLGDQKDSI